MAGFMNGGGYEWRGLWIAGVMNGGHPAIHNNESQCYEWRGLWMAGILLFIMMGSQSYDWRGVSVYYTQQINGWITAKLTIQPVANQTSKLASLYSKWWGVNLMTGSVYDWRGVHSKLVENDGESILWLAGFMTGWVYTANWWSWITNWNLELNIMTPCCKVWIELCILLVLTILNQSCQFGPSSLP